LRTHVGAISLFSEVLRAGYFVGFWNIFGIRARSGFGLSIGGNRAKAPELELFGPPAADAAARPSATHYF
jgi:hypothetical protein